MNTYGMVPMVPTLAGGYLPWSVGYLLSRGGVPTQVGIPPSERCEAICPLMLHLYWRESESYIAWNGLLLFDASYLHWSESEIDSDVAPKWVATHSGATLLAAFRFRSNIIAP